MKHDEVGPPCRHMESLLQEAADGSAKGWRRWYAVAHAARCTRCGTFLGRMQAMVKVLSETKDEPIPEDAKERLLAGAWRTINPD
jgi:hypothetical protein